MVKKSRELVTSRDQYRYTRDFYNSAGFANREVDDKGVLLGRQTQITESEGHPRPYRYRGRDNGGPFMTRRRYVNDDRSETANPQPQYSFKYDQTQSGANFRRHSYFGPVYAVNPTLASNYPEYSSSDAATLDAWGAKAIALCKPTNSVADLGTALGEILREGLPSMLGASTWKDRSSKVRGASGDYLNLQFGWLPLISDVRKAATAYRESAKILKQFERDSGRLVRRQFSFPDIKEVTEHVQVSPTPSGNARPWTPTTLGAVGGFFTGGAPNPGAQLWRTKEREVKRWFSGAFTYYLPRSNSLDGLTRQLALADKLYGVSVDPEMLWNLTPWTWALDWVGNMGDVISNVSDAQTYGLVMPYGYMMEESITKYTYTWIGLNLPGLSTVSTTFTSHVKLRRAASPYGFGLTWDGFSPKQLSILAALGITRKR